MELLSKNGYRFSTEGNKVYIESSILTTKRPTLEGVKGRIEALKHRQKQSGSW